MSLDQEITEIVQLPAIVHSGMIKIMDPSLLKLEEKDLQRMAIAMGGELVYMKVRATYTELGETPLCGQYNCYRPVKGAIYCNDHDKAKSTVRPLGIVNPKSDVG